MKTKIISAFLVVSLVILASCNWIDPGLNVDPTSPKDATFATILPTTQVGIAYVLGGDIGRYSSLFTQHHMGTTRQHYNLYQYKLNESDLDNAWTSVYTGPMTDFKIMIDKANTMNAPYYKGISQILTAFCLGMWTDILGDIPYSDALKGQDGKQPMYDTQEQIYTSIFKLLNDGITASTGDKGLFQPKADDFIYGGVMANWVKAANALKARYYLHLKDYNNALTAITGGFASNADDLQVNFVDNDAYSNPFYQFMGYRGDIAMGGGLMNLMATFKDPRIVTYTDDTVYAEGVYTGTFFASAPSPVFFMTYVEQKFIEAECKLATSDKPGAYKAYMDAIKASMEKYGIDATEITAYLANTKVGVGEGALTLQNIIEQKYIALYTQPETWTDWRRTGFPKLNPVSGTQIPRRFIYPQSERLFNGANLEKAIGASNPNFIYTKMWWDAKW